MDGQYDDLGVGPLAMSLTFQLELVETVWNEVMVLAELHWRGTTGFRRHEPFDPSFARYQACNASGFFQLFTARDGPRLAGYFGMYLSPSMHSQRLMATEDTFYLHPDSRKGTNALRFIKHIEAQCRVWGVQEILFSCEIDNPVANRLLERLDYQPVIMQYRKHLSLSPRADSAHMPHIEDCANVGES